MRPRLLAILAIAIAAAILVLILSRGGGPRNQPGSVGGIADSVAKGASAVLMAAQQAPPGAQELHIALPDALIHAPATPVPAQTDSTASALYAAAGWRGALIAATAAIRIPALTAFVTTDRKGAQAPGAAFYLDGSVRTSPGENPALGMIKLDTITASAARRQLDDNLRVLMRGLPAGSITRATVTMIPVDPAHKRIAFAVELRVKDLRSLSRYFGDVFDGLGTGLAPGQSSTVEGLSIHAVDGGGRNAGSWMATRAQQGTTVMDPRVHPPAVMVPRLRFVNETGGPDALASAHGGPVR